MDDGGDDIAVPMDGVQGGGAPAPHAAPAQAGGEALTYNVVQPLADEMEDFLENTRDALEGNPNAFTSMCIDKDFFQPHRVNALEEASFIWNDGSENVDFDPLGQLGYHVCFSVWPPDWSQEQPDPRDQIAFTKDLGSDMLKLLRTHLATNGWTDIKNGSEFSDMGIQGFRFRAHKPNGEQTVVQIVYDRTCVSIVARNDFHGDDIAAVKCRMKPLDLCTVRVI